MPGGLIVGVNYDKDGQVTGLEPSGRSEHAFERNEWGQLTSYEPPTLNATPSPLEVGWQDYSYNEDRQIEDTFRSDNVLLDAVYDSVSGQVTHINHGTAPYLTFSYVPDEGKLSSISREDGWDVTWNWDGALMMGQSWSGGAVLGASVGWTYTPSLLLDTQNVSGASVVEYGYDNDGLLTSATFDTGLSGTGSYSINRNASNGVIEDTLVSNVSEDFSLDKFAAIEQTVIAYSGSDIWTVDFIRDDLNRITQKTEYIDTNGGGLPLVANITNYDYDTAGRLSYVHYDSNGDGIVDATESEETYSYDDNGNRYPSAGVAPDVDAQDRLNSWNDINYSYDNHGVLTSRTDTITSETTTYGYDIFGQLRTVTLPDNTQVNYGVDASGRRVSRLENGVPTHYYVYQGSRLVAEVNNFGNAETRYVYATRRHVPDLMIRGGTTYRLLTDHLGSVRMVVDVDTGTVAQHIEYDVWGKVLSDSNPGFQEFGYAGGLYDPLTNLVRFGARDYDPEIGRWTAKDPIRFAGGDGNLYAYVGNNPVNWVDPSGLYLETPLDLISLGTGIVSFGTNLTVGNYGAAAVDGVGILADFVSVLSPTPGGVGLGIKAAREAGAAGCAVMLTRSQAKNVQKIRNVITHNAKPHDFSGVAAELAGNPIPKPGGGHWDHVTEMRQSVSALEGAVNSLQQSLKNPNLDSGAQAQIQSAIDEAVPVLNDMKNALSGG